MRSPLDSRPALSERVALAITEEQKRAAFAAASRKNMGLSEYIREAMATAAADGDNPDNRAAV